MRIVKIVGLALVAGCWFWARDMVRGEQEELALIWCAPLLQFPITLLGRRALDKQPVRERAEKTSVLVHYAMMIALGISIFPAIQRVQQRPRGVLPFPPGLGNALVWLTACATGLTVLNLAWRGLGAPFAAKLSSRLATDWTYAWTRNPMLLCTLALLVSVGLRYRSVWLVLWAILIISPGWIYFVRVYEERELETRFGNRYTEYQQQNGVSLAAQTAERSGLPQWRLRITSAFREPAEPICSPVDAAVAPAVLWPLFLFHSITQTAGPD
jgi:protein-S-isoprenylcysteine O-methyltransferase Ste14